MARYCGTKETASKIDIAGQWKEKSLLKGESLFSNQTIVTTENIQTLETLFANSIEQESRDFFDNLEYRLTPTSTAVKMLVAEMVWLMMLCPSNIRPITKRQLVARVWSWSGLELDDSQPLLSDSALDGIGSAGTSYGTNRWRELVYFVQFLTFFSALTLDEKQALLDDGWKFAQWLERVPDNNNRQLRHMLLFLLFPDDFERIFSITDRKMVVAAFTGKTRVAIKTMTAIDIDRELAAIRQQQVDDFGIDQLDFYATPLRELWKDKSHKSWLFTWNPKHWTWKDIDKAIIATRQGKTSVVRWSCTNTGISAGDRAWLVRLGVSPKGIIATGNVISEPYEEEHWDQAKADRGHTCRFVDIEFTRVVDVHNDNFVTLDVLEKISLDKQRWTPQASGIEIKKRSAGLLEKCWDQLVSKSSDIHIASQEITTPVNVILFGPPGTGKTYELNKLIERYTRSAPRFNDEQGGKYQQDRYEFVTFHQAYSYEDFVEGIRPVQDEQTRELVYRVVPGVFKRICEKALNDSQHRYAIFIDEINRGNVAKIFGELITLIEVDKRAIYDESELDKHNKTGMSLTLPYSGDVFSVPKNLDIYGTMNTADRSIALLDTALRRRFTFKEMLPDSGFITGSRGDGYIEDGEGGVINLRALLDAMNLRIQFLLNRDLMLGHAYFCKVKNFTMLKDVFFHQLIPMLQEYFYDDWHRIQLVFRDVGPDNDKLEPQIIEHYTLTDRDVLGFDHDDFDGVTQYRVANDMMITPDSIRKIYESQA